jgi:hypothetical protein
MAGGVLYMVCPGAGVFAMVWHFEVKRKPPG